MRLTRRQLLAVGVAGTAGCVERASRVHGTGAESTQSSTATPTEPARSPTPTRTQTGSSAGAGVRTGDAGTPSPDQAPPDRPSRSISIVELRRREGAEALSAAATVVEDSTANEGPPRMRFTITADAPTRVRYWDCPPGNLHRAQHTTTDDRLVVSEYDGDAGTGTCWQIPTATLNMGRPCVEEPVTVTPDEPFVRSFGLWNDRANASCYPTGRYRVDFRVDVDDSTGRTYRWSVVVRVTS